MRKKGLIIVVLAACAACVLFLVYPFIFSARPSITFFPENGGVHYQAAATGLELDPATGTINWTVGSEIDHRAYLMQDFSLLYKNNRLIAMINHWERNATTLWQKKQFQASPGCYQSLSVHEAEIHSGGRIYGKTELSEDQLFIGWDQAHFVSFKAAASKKETELSSQYKNRIAFTRAELLRKASKKYGFNPGAYQIFPLFELTPSSVRTLFPFNRDKAWRITVQLWEGIYKTFLQGIETSSGRYEPAVGSSMPLLLIAGDHLLIVIETSRGDVVLLKQVFN
ncbi:hypothetical protein [Sporolactobacillus putidus]|uniref:Uncharacterized protein n=1 Tax=Sporolactobacillus putidus TaxID=492735 RepID=A0A917S8F6_9BACL|nr:hypothetical protein [Sporolactobacillus putidus]GGL61416.1 hypothetical protein GCM10007968_26770 [Sporolactobacillus putidus]